MPLFNPAQLRNPYMACFEHSGYPPVTKVETAVEESAYQLETRGIRSETTTSININRGELETSANRGDFYRFQIPVVTATDSYFVTVDFVDNGAGAAAATPIIATRDEDIDALSTGQYDPNEAFITGAGGPVYASAYSLEDLQAWASGQPVVETAPNYEFFSETPVSGGGGGVSGGGGYYQPETAEPFIPPPVEEGQQDPVQQQQDEYERAYQDYLLYIAAQEEQIDYYGTGEPAV